MDKPLKAKIAKWVSEMGRAKAGAALVHAGINIDTAVKLLNGTYSSSPKKELTESIELAISTSKEFY